MCKHATDDEIKKSEMMKPNEAIFYFNEEKEDGEDSIGSDTEDEVHEGIFQNGFQSLEFLWYNFILNHFII